MDKSRSPLTAMQQTALEKFAKDNGGDGGRPPHHKFCHVHAGTACDCWHRRHLGVMVFDLLDAYAALLARAEAAEELERDYADLLRQERKRAEAAEAALAALARAAIDVGVYDLVVDKDDPTRFISVSRRSLNKLVALAHAALAGSSPEPVCVEAGHVRVRGNDRCERCGEYTEATHGSSSPAAEAETPPEEK